MRYYTILFIFWSLTFFSYAQPKGSEPPSALVHNYINGWKSLGRLNFPEAIKRFKVVMDSRPESPLGYYGLAKVHLMRSELHAARLYIDSALIYIDNQVDIIILAGDIQFKLKNFESARRHYLQALNLVNETDIRVVEEEVFSKLGEAYLAESQFDSAEYYLKRAVRHNPNAFDYFNLGISQTNQGHRGKGCYSFAISQYFGYQVPDKIKALCPDGSVVIDTMSLKALRARCNSYTDTIYFDKYGNWTTEPKAFIYRLSTYSIAESKFIGHFKDYYMNDQMISEGQYNAKGQLDGQFVGYHKSLHMYCEGQYSNGKMTGEWNFFFDSGKPAASIVFDRDEWKVLRAFNENGDIIVREGTGYWEFDLLRNGTQSLEGSIKNYKREGEWILKYTKTDKTIRKEIFVEGQFESGIKVSKGSEKGQKNSYFNKSRIFDRYYANKAGKTNDATRSKYPFMMGQPYRSEHQLFIALGGEPMSDNDWFDIVEEAPRPQGGMQAFYKYVSQNMRYPKEAKKKGVEGRVFVQFIVDKDGSLIDFKVIKGIGAGCDDEAIRVIQNSPKWYPGYQRGEPEKVRRIIPITFKLGSKSPSFNYYRKTNSSFNDPFRNTDF